MPPSSDRALFANQLRAIAIIAVIITHWCGVFWYSRDVVAQYIHAPALEGPPSSVIQWLTIPSFNYGPFGVAIFFMISGFVIPFSLARLTPKNFLIARALRIYPTYIVASVIMLGLSYLSSRYWNQPFKISTHTLLANLALINGDLYRPSIDLVNWTLSVEIKFYILAAILYKSIRSGNLNACLLASIMILAFCQWQAVIFDFLNISLPSFSVEGFKAELICVIFMFTGTVFYHHYTGAKSTKELAAQSSMFLILFFLCWPTTSWAPQLHDVAQNYLYGAAVFATSYALRRYFRPFQPIDFIANISYPIYALHSIIGYLTIRILMDMGCRFPVAGLLTLTFVVGLAYTLHRLVEKPTMHLGKRIAAPSSAAPREAARDTSG